MPGDPKISIEVDERTGVWCSDGLPMLYVPRHFLVNNHVAIASSFGVEDYAKVLYKSGYRSSYFWCEQESKINNLTGMGVFIYYLERLSVRGWGQFQFSNVDESKGSAEIVLYNSAFVLQQPEVRAKLCYMFAGWFAGAMDWVMDDAGAYDIRTECRETECASEGKGRCIFAITPLVQ